MAKSVRDSACMDQKPTRVETDVARHSSGTLVVARATSMIPMSGITASRVNSPRRTRTAQAISMAPTTWAIISGAGIPIRATAALQAASAPLPA